MARPLWWELDGQDAYDLLGVDEDATLAEIVAAHRRQMKLWHTDTSNFAAAEERSRYLNKAREILEHHRAAYDEIRRQPVAPESAPYDPHDPWDEVPEDPWEEVPDDPWERAETGPPPPRPPHWSPRSDPYEDLHPPPAAPVYERPSYDRAFLGRVAIVVGLLFLAVVVPPVGFLAIAITAVRWYLQRTRGSGFLGFQLAPWWWSLWRRRRMPIHERPLPGRVLGVAGLVLLTLVAPPLGLIVSAIAAIRMYRQGTRGWDFQWTLAVLAGAVPWWIVYVSIAGQ